MLPSEVSLCNLQLPVHLNMGRIVHLQKEKSDKERCKTSNPMIDIESE